MKIDQGVLLLVQVVPVLKGRAKLSLNKDTLLVGGDSGKAWIQIQNGKMVCVGLNSTTHGYGPPVWDLLLKWVNNKKVAADAEVLAPGYC